MVLILWKKSKEFKIKAKKEIEKLTAMNVEEFEVVIRNIHVPEEKL